MQISNEIMTFIHPGNKAKETDNTQFGRRFRRLCHQYGIKVRYVGSGEVFDLPGTLSEPIVIGWNCSVATYKKLNVFMPQHRLILISESAERMHRRMSLICSDTGQIAREVLTYLKEAGRGKLALFAFDRYAVNTGRYIKEFEEAATQINCAFSSGDAYLNDEKMLASCFSELLKQIHRYDSVFCANDMAALYLITELKKHGIRVPEDIFVIGRGNSPVARMAVPSITSVDLMVDSCAEQCVALWQYLKKHPDVMRANITVGHRFIIRESTAEFRPSTEWKDELPKPHQSGTDRGYGILDQLNRFLLTADSVDRKILGLIAAGKGYEEISDEIFLTVSAIKYRVKKMLQLFGVNHRRELIELLQQYPLKF